MKGGLYLNTGSYFQWPVKLVGASFLFFGLVFLIDASYQGGLFFIFSGLISLTTNYFFFIDVHRKIYQDGVRVLGLRIGKKIKYNDVEYLFVKLNKVSRTYNSHIQRKIVSENEFDAYIRFSELVKVHLFSNKKRIALMKKLTPLAHAKFRLLIIPTSNRI